MSLIFVGLINKHAEETYKHILHHRWTKMKYLKQWAEHINKSYLATNYLHAIK
jgi:hypothetical protein